MVNAMARTAEITGVEASMESMMRERFERFGDAFRTTQSAR
jgi:hypothetical protein